MRLFILAVTLAGLSLSFTGCGSEAKMPSRMRDRFSAPEPKVQTFEANQPLVFEAAQTALRRLDFQVSRAGMAQGILNAHSRLQPAGQSFGKARQYVMEVRVDSYEPDTTNVAVVLREQEESSSFAGATDLVLREHGLYASFFAALEQVLRERSKPLGDSVKTP